jgi:flagellar biogenesis protein FliO
VGREAAVLLLLLLLLLLCGWCRGRLALQGQTKQQQQQQVIDTQVMDLRVRIMVVVTVGETLAVGMVGIRLPQAAAAAQQVTPGEMAKAIACTTAT